MGALSLALAGATAAALLVIAVMPATDVSGTDLEAINGVGLGWRIVHVALGVASLAVPVAVVVVARKMWLGWVLLLLAVSAAILGAGLWTLGII